MPSDSAIWSAATGGLVMMIGIVVYICAYVVIFTLVIDIWRITRNERECVYNTTANW